MAAQPAHEGQAEAAQAGVHVQAHAWGRRVGSKACQAGACRPPHSKQQKYDVGSLTCSGPPFSASPHQHDCLYKQPLPLPLLHAVPEMP